MSGWKEYKLGEILAPKGYIRGPFGSALKRPEMKSSGYAVYEQQHAIHNTRKFRYFIDESKFNELIRFKTLPNDLIISCSGTVGEISIIQESDPKGIISQALLALRPNLELISPKFLFYFFKNRYGYNQLISASHGSVQVNIAKREVVESIKISLPNRAKQNLITEVLSSLDDKIELNNKINQELENLAQTLFKQWFIDFEFPNENGEPYKSSGGEMVESELGEIPKGWEIQSLEGIAELVRGISYRKHELVSKEEGVPFVSLKCFALDGTFRQDGLKYFNGKFKDSHVIQADDILVAVTDLTQDRLVIGLPIVWQNDDIALPSLDVCIIRPQEKILKDFLLYEFKTHRYKSRIIEFANGSTVLHLSIKGLETYEIGIPSIDLLSKWSEIVKPILKSMGDNVKENQQLTILRDTLLPKLISGELEVSQSQTTA